MRMNQLVILMKNILRWKYESPVSEWSKEDEYSNWFASFDNIEEEENDDGFEVID